MLNTNNKNKGQVLVLVALSMVVIIGFAALAIDFAYFYHTKNQLQGAADAAALAGAAKLTDTSDLIQANARQEAIRYAGENKAAGSSVVLAPGGFNNFSSNNDITVGNWNGTTYRAGITPVNAVQVRARRTSDSPGGSIRTFFGGIFAMLPGASGIYEVDVSSVAVASVPPRASMNISFCFKVCDDAPEYPETEFLIPPRMMKVGTSNSTPVVNDSQQLAFTNLGDQSNTNTNALRAAICGGPTDKDVCDQELYATMSASTPLMNSLQYVFLDPNYDKELDPTKPGKRFENVSSTHQNQVVWWAIVPVLDECAPTVQGAAHDPKLVVQYAYVRIIGVCPKNQQNNQCGASANPEPPICATGTPQDKAYDRIIIDHISCISCSNKFTLLGTRPFLVK